MSVEVLSAPWVLPGRPEASGAAAVAIADGAVALDGDLVVAIGPRAEIEARFGPGERLDAVILPALVNAHLHLELSHLAGRVAGGSGLAAWIGRFISARAEANAEAGTGSGGPSDIQPRSNIAAMAAAAGALRAAGVAAVGDVSNTLASLEPLARAGLCGTVFHEVLGFTRERYGAFRAAARAERGVRPAPRGLCVRESPHAVYSMNREAILELLRAGPCSIHLAEDPAEREFCRAGTGPFLRLLEGLGATEIQGLRVRGRSAVAAVGAALGPDHLAVHCVDLDGEDLAVLAASGATAVLCPRSNRFISNLLPSLPGLLEAGVPLAVGTDSLASSPSLAPLAELALLRSAYPAVPAARLLPLAWNGAAVGAPHVGRLTPGEAPGVLAAPLEGAPHQDPFELLLDALGAGERDAPPLRWIRPNAPEARA